MPDAAGPGKPTPPRRPACPMPEYPWACPFQWAHDRKGAVRSVRCLGCGAVNVAKKPQSQTQRRGECRP
jgi:hypothetical protein